MAVDMVKGQKLSLEKPGGGQLTLVRMGLGWDALKKGGFFGRREQEIDLDASVVAFADSQPIDVVYFGQLTSKDGSIRHTGDNTTGAGDGDDESILVDLSRVPPHITALIFTVSSYTGQTFAEVDNAFCRLVDETSNTELARYTLSGGSDATAQIMAKVYRHNGQWKMAAIGEPGKGKTFKELLPLLHTYL